MSTTEDVAVDATVQAGPTGAGACWVIGVTVLTIRSTTVGCGFGAGDGEGGEDGADPVGAVRTGDGVRPPALRIGAALPTAPPV